MTNKNLFQILRIGLALVFLANAINAFFAPQEFKELIESSFLLPFIPFSISTLVIIIGINDSLLTLLILLNKFQKYVLVWAMLWLVGVMVVVKEVPGILEHIGFFSMSLVLWLDSRDGIKN